MTRTNTPDELVTDDTGHTVTRRTLKRDCNGCGFELGDTQPSDVDANGNLTDVRAECPNCAPVVEAEAAGCETWRLTEATYSAIDSALDDNGVFTKGYTQAVGPEQRLTVVGMRIGSGPDRVVAFWCDWIIRDPSGVFSVHRAPVAEGSAA